MPGPLLTWMLLSSSLLVIPSAVLWKQRRINKSLSSTMQTAAVANNHTTAFAVARQLPAPTAASTAFGEAEHADFWERHGKLLTQAWTEWESTNGSALPALEEEALIDPTLFRHVHATWKNPSEETEKELRKDLSEVAPNVYQCKLLQPESIVKIRQHLEAVSNAGIPKRRPNGMNRYGLIVDSESEGAVSTKALMDFREWLVDSYIRPMGRMLFPEIVGTGDDACAYAFTIRYRSDEDVALKEHSDASVVTMNINLNLPHEEYTGSALYFVDEHGEKHVVDYKPGMALLHRGLMRHAALPIQSGERHNLVVWLFGQHGYVRIAPYLPHERLSVRQRWSKSFF